MRKDKLSFPEFLLFALGSILAVAGPLSAFFLLVVNSENGLGKLYLPVSVGMTVIGYVILRFLRPDLRKVVASWLDRIFKRP